MYETNVEDVFAVVHELVDFEVSVYGGGCDGRGELLTSLG